MTPKVRVLMCVSLIVLGACAEGLAPKPKLGIDVPDMIRTPNVQLSRSTAVASVPLAQSPGKLAPHGPAFDEFPDSTTAVDNGWLALVTAYGEAWFADGGTADGYGYTYYFGNYATMTLNLQLFRDAESIATATPKTSSRNPFLPVPGDWTDNISIPSSIQCGLNSTATVNSHSEVDALGGAGLIPISKADD